MLPLKYDFHIHSCLSPCGGRDMTPFNIANMAAMAGYDVIAVADHNCCANCRAVIEASEDAGILAIPAMELTTSEEAHVLCLFEDIAHAEAFSDLVYDGLMDIAVNTKIYYEQLIMNKDDEIIGTRKKLLATASRIGIYDAVRVTAQYGGIAVPAHVDKQSFSLISILGSYDKTMGFSAVELSKGCDRDEFRRQRTDMKGLSWITDSDAHCLEDMPDAMNYISASGASNRELLDAIANNNHKL